MIVDGASRHLRFPQRGLVILAALWFLAASVFEAAAASPWTLDPASSSLKYQSVKKITVIETNQIRNLSGTIQPDGAASVLIDLNSVETGIDIRNVRMRFLFFETFKYPMATVSAHVDPAAFADLPTKRRLKLKLPFTLDLHGFVKELQADVVVTMISDTMVSVASDGPIEIKAEDFGLGPAIEKLERAGDVTNIVPIGSVSFDFVFVTGAKSPTAPTPAAAASNGPIVTDAAKKSYTAEECHNRFDVISRTGAIYFKSGSADLDPASRPLLTVALDAIVKCPALKVEIAGYTDSDGAAEENVKLSQRRAEAVVAYLKSDGVAADRLFAKGYGATRPVAPNDTDKNKALNRRIEFVEPSGE
ncbi:MAG TPA: OmpA family protein [Roseiarcus sp.]|jgi:outer membrane protein OmpA-like peptidoglycan-associated protein/polyisoprenoid-binding protein YceI